MPFTPFHCGPGAALKAVIPRHFSFTVFCFVQVVTDCETGYYMIRGLYPWHRFFHTFVGATLVAVASILVARPLCQFWLRLWLAWRDAPFKRYFPCSPLISWRSALVAAFIGTYSHVLLDSIMHSDARPLMPFNEANPLYNALSLFVLHALCMVLGLFGTFYIAFTSSRTP